MERAAERVRMRLLVVGRWSSFLGPARDEYLSRLRRRHDVEWFEVPAAPASVEQERALALESEQVERLLSAVSRRVILDRQGRSLASEEVAERLRRWEESGATVGFAVGGARGLSPVLVRRASETWSFGRATWPHAMCATMLLEQLYRADSLLRGEPYHRGEG